MVSRLATLDAKEFDLLLSLLDTALTGPRRADGTRTARTSDGRLLVTLRPPADEHKAPHLVRLEVASGVLHCLDYRLEVEDALSPTAQVAVRGAG